MGLSLLDFCHLCCGRSCWVGELEVCVCVLELWLWQSIRWEERGFVFHRILVEHGQPFSHLCSISLTNALSTAQKGFDRFYKTEDRGNARIIQPLCTSQGAKPQIHLKHQLLQRTLIGEQCGDACKTKGNNNMVVRFLSCLNGRKQKASIAPKRIYAIVSRLSP